jgi:hypothetical protein
MMYLAARRVKERERKRISKGVNTNQQGQGLTHTARNEGEQSFFLFPFSVFVREERRKN